MIQVYSCFNVGMVREVARSTSLNRSVLEMIYIYYIVISEIVYSVIIVLM